MSATAVSPPERSSPPGYHPDDETLARYSAVSRLAILALFMGLASALALASPILVIVPLAAAVIAIVALRQIATSGGQYTGHWSATAGLCLAMLFAGWGMSREWTRQGELHQHARKFAEGWLELVRAGKLQRAHQFTHSAGSRLNSDAAIAEFYQTNPEAGEMMKTLFTSEPLKSVTSMRDSGSVAFRSVAGKSKHGFTDSVTLQFAVRPSETSDEMPMWVTVSRTADANAQHPSWQIGSVTGTPPN